ncbi:MAG: glycosyltransferase, partial [Bacteroidales bacterium]|nr:glycosyltransferase [Bacteroidales bacterium]
VLPSKFESFGLVLTEAMQFRKPVIGVRAGGPAEIIADGENGFLVPPDDPTALAQAMQTLIQSAELRERMGARSRELYESQFTVNVMAVRTITCHRAVIQSWQSHLHPTTLLRPALGQLIARVTGLEPAQAAAAVGELVPEPWSRLSSREYLTRTQKLINAQNSLFIQGIYSLLLCRRPTREEFENWLTHLENGLPRRTLLEEFAFGPEAAKLGLPTDWIEAVHLPSRATVVPAADALAFRARLRRWVGQIVLRLSRLPGVGKFFRVLRHFLQAPRRIRNLEERTTALQEFVAQQIGTLRSTVKAQTVAVENMAKQTAMRDRQMQWTLHTQATQHEQTLTHSPWRSRGDRYAG